VKFTDRDLQDITEAIDQRVERRIARLPQFGYGIVAAVSGSVASVKIAGNTTASSGFAIPPRVIPSVGDLVRVVIDANGDRWIDDDLSANVVASDEFMVNYGGKIYCPDQSPGTDPSSIEMHNEDETTRVMRIRVGDDAGDAVDVGYYYYADQSWHSGVRLNVNGHAVFAGPINSEEKAWNFPSLSNGWVNYGASFDTAAYRRDASGYVHLRGLIKGGTNATDPMFTLPSGYRPTAQGIFVCAGGAGPTRVDVTSTGVVEQTSTAGYTLTTAWVSLDGIVFFAG
jgi:hypothetical protein